MAFGELTEGVVLAADGLSIAERISGLIAGRRARMYEMSLPGVAGNANDGDGAAGDSDGDVHILNYDAQESEEACHGGGACRLDAVAALNGTSAALSALGGGCNSDSGQSESDDELELHGNLFGSEEKVV